MTDTSTLREAANVPQTVSAIRIALDTSNQQIDSAQQYVTIEDCLAYGKRILDAQTAQPNLQLCAQKVEGDAPDQTEVSPGPDATPTDNTALVEALKKANIAFDALFSHCLSNGVFNAWHKPINTAPINEAMSAVSAALASREAKPGPDAVEVAWQPIETAPKDETPFIAHLNMGLGSEYAVMMWHEGEEDWTDSFGAIIGYPTHWMPLPAPHALAQGSRP